MLVDQISKDYVTAMKVKDSVRSSTLSFLRSQLKYAMIDKKTEHLEDADAIQVIKKQIKQRQDSIEQFKKGGRTELAEKENKELEILTSYLPKELSDEKLAALVDEAILEVKATGMKDMGAVMKVVLVKAAGQADSKRVSDLVKMKLSK